MRAQLVRHPASRAAALAIAVVTVSQALVLIVRGTHPFGAGNVNINDLWHQLLPFHAHLGHLVRGDGPSDWQYNWSSGLGVPWLPDFGTYLAGPGTVAASLAPPAALDLAVTVATTAMMAGAAAMMVAYLYRLRPGGPWWLLGLLGASYGMCAWAVAEAAYVPMWLAGLVALPALALAGEWARSNSHFLASVLIVWAAWWSNYYTAYMATLGAVVLVVLHLVADQVGWRAGLQALLRFAVRGVLGVAMAMVLLLPVLLAIRAGAPGIESTLALPNEGFLARLLPGTESVRISPALGLSSLALVLTFAFPFLRSLPLRLRAVYLTGAAVVLGSMAVPATAIAWHAFTVPNGTGYRAAFVACGLIVVLAWLAASSSEVATRTGPAPFYGAFLLVALYATAWLTPHLLSWTTGVSVAAAVTVVLAWRLLPPRWLPGSPWAGLLVCSLMVVELGLVSAAMLDLRERSLPPSEMARMGLVVPPMASITGQEELTGWPHYRTAYVVADYSIYQNNFPAVVNDPGVAYYSSLVPGEVSEAHRALGGPFGGHGRSLGEPSEQVLRGLLGYKGFVARIPGEAAVSSADHPAFPVVRVASPTTGDSAAPGPFGLRDQLLAAPIHEMPELFLDGGSPVGTQVLEQPFTLSGSCEPGRALVFSEFPGDYTVAFTPEQALEVSTRGVPQLSGVGVVYFGDVPEDGNFTFRFTDVEAPASPRHGHIACVDTAGFTAQAEAAGATAPQELRIDGGRIRAAWDHPVTGDVIVATFNLTGWACEVDGEAAAIHRRGGMMALQADDAREVSCRYRTPGLAAGAAISLSAAAITGTVAVLRWRQGRLRVGAARRGGADS